MEYNQIVKNKGLTEKIINEVCTNCDITKEELFGPGRFIEYVDARRQISLRLRNELKMSYSRIGRILHRDHTVIVHYLKPRKAKKE